MNIAAKIKRALRGEVTARRAAAESWLRLRQMNSRRRERAHLDELDSQPARLCEEFRQMQPDDLLAHFRSRVGPKFFPGLLDAKHTATIQSQLFPDETKQLIADADRIVKEHCWTLLGLGEKCLGADGVPWNRDPLSGFDWPLDYHAHIRLIRSDGSDARVVWELNRLGHLITLGRAYAITADEQFTTESLDQVASWRRQNPVGCGINWTSAMEVALRAINLLAAFELLLRSPQLDESKLHNLLTMFDQHGSHIWRNLEFSHLATSNHYLCDVAGLLWIGIMLPELEAASGWQEFGLRQLLNEMDKQILADGADYEAATGYHRLKVELFLYSFVLCDLNGIAIPKEYWDRLQAMLKYLRAYLRPDGRAPMIGDSDNSRVLPIAKRTSDDHDYLLSMTAAVFGDSQFKIKNSKLPQELLWVLGEQGLRNFQALPETEVPQSQAFDDVGVYVLRDADLYLHFNAGGCGMKGRGSHGHNDALSVEVSAYGTAFIVDPGSYVYTADLHQRHLFRSTTYHSTVQVDGEEQNSINETEPFVIGNEAQPRMLDWQTTADTDRVVAEHYGYRRLPSAVTHRRSVIFNKTERFWAVDDEFAGRGNHEFCFRFHLAPSSKVSIRSDSVVEVRDEFRGARLSIEYQNEDRERPQSGRDEIQITPSLEENFVSNDYGAKQPSVSVCWTINASVPFSARFFLRPSRDT